MEVFIHSFHMAKGVVALGPTALILPLEILEQRALDQCVLARFEDTLHKLYN